MPAKPVKWGVKVWVLCDLINGYICTFDVYTGKDTSGSTVHARGLAYSIVMKLVQSYLKKGHIIYTDNYYSSPQLFEDLEEGTYASGTVRTNRKHFPVFLRPQPGDKLDRGSHMFAYHKSTTVVRWSDNRDVYALSTFVSDATTQVRRRGGSASISISCPEIIHDYNHFMGGVDLADQAMCYYSVGRKTMKWWRHIFWRMHNHATINAHVIYKANTATSLSKPISNLKFRLLLAQQLVEPYLSEGVWDALPQGRNDFWGSTSRITQNKENGAKCVLTRKCLQGPRNAGIRRQRSGALSVRCTYVWGDALSILFQANHHI